MTGSTTTTFRRYFAVLVLAIGALLVLMPRSEAQAGPVIINELQARNATTIADGDDDFPDWIELHNITSSPVSIAGWKISDSGAEWTIPAGTTIPGDGYLLIWASDKGLAGPAGEIHTNFKLGGGGDSVTLINGFIVQDTVTYAIDLPDDSSYGRDATGDFVFFPVGDATPGEVNGAPTPPTPTPSPTPTAVVGDASVLINEVMQANNTTIADDGGAGQFEDWIELYNPRCQTVDISGWMLRDSADSWPIPAGTTIDPGELLFIWASNKGDINDADFPGPAGELHTNFRLAAAGEDLFLLDGNGLLVGTVNPGPTIADESYARTAADSYVIATGTDVTPGELNPGQSAVNCEPTPTPVPPTATPTATPVPPTPTPGGEPTPTPTITPTPTATPVPPTATPTPTATATSIPIPTATATPGVVPCASGIVINEVQTRNGTVILDGDGDSSDWIELFNASDDTIELDGWTISDSANTFDIPAGNSIDAGQYLLVWASDKGEPTDPGFPGPADEIHASFRLSGDGEVVTLADATGCQVDQLTVPALAEQASYGVLLAGGVGVFDPGFATPNARNSSQQRYAVSAPCYATSPVRMNRIVARNDSLLADADGDYSDFIELYNTDFDPVDLTVWQIGDQGRQWTIPAGTIIDGYGTLIIWASAKGDHIDDQFPGPDGELHASFKLAGEGELLTLAEPSGCIIEELIYPELEDDEAWGYDAQDQRAILVPAPAAATCAAPGSVQITGIQAKNDSTLADEDGDFGDWIEIRNATTDAIELTGWVVSDDSNVWVIPDGVVLDAEAELLIWADAKDRGGVDAALHTNFKLGGDGETVTVGSASNCPVDVVSYPALEDDQVFRLGDDAMFSVQGAAPADEPEAADEPAVTGDVNVVGTCIAINEIMAKNDTTLEDEDGEFGDWIELVNLSDEAIDLSGYTISDEEDTWTIPDDVTIEADGYLLIWADGSDRGAAGEPLHTNFKLGGGGEPITLTTADGDVAASFSSYPELEDDETFGVNDEGNYVVRGAGAATPGEGPTLAGCDFEVGSGAGSADEAEAGGDAEATGETDDPEAAPLARTGTSAGRQALAAQMLILSGLTLVVMGRIAARRHRLG